MLSGQIRDLKGEANYSDEIIAALDLTQAGIVLWRSALCAITAAYCRLILPGWSATRRFKLRIAASRTK